LKNLVKRKEFDTSIVVELRFCPEDVNSGFVFEVNVVASELRCRFVVLLVFMKLAIAAVFQLKLNTTTSFNK
jgi:hypothetical protein